MHAESALAPLSSTAPRHATQTSEQGGILAAIARFFEREGQSDAPAESAAYWASVTRGL